MYFAPLRTTALLLFSLLTLSYALPTRDHNLDTKESSSDLTARVITPQNKNNNKAPTQSKPKPKPKSGGKGPDTSKKPPSASTTKKDGQVSKSYKPKIRVRDEDIEYYKRELAESRLYGGNSIELQERNSVNYDSTLEARRGGVGDIAEVVVSIINAIKNGIAADKLARGEYTQETVSNARAKFPQYNWVMCHTKHETHFDGEQGKDWGHQHAEFDVKIGGTIGYEIYWVKSGMFSRSGDGGYLNWAWTGNVNPEGTKTDKKGATVQFIAPS